MSEYHECPAPGCTRVVPWELLACSGHWYSLPGPMRAAIWRAWAEGSGAGSAAHTAAVRAAVEYLRRPR